jgi:hypothetical protein
VTLPDEAHRAVLQTRRFLVDLLDPKKTPRVPSAIRVQARRLVKHYPFDCEVEINTTSFAKIRIKSKPTAGKDNPTRRLT